MHLPSDSDFAEIENPSKNRSQDVYDAYGWRQTVLEFNRRNHCTLQK
jgi:hypothetical protein